MELKHEKGAKEAIVELESLIRWQRIARNSAGNPNNSGSLTDSVAKTLFYYKLGKSDTDLGIGKIKKASIDFAKNK